MIKFPNGKEYKPSKKLSNSRHISSANRGMDLEHHINIANEYYREHRLILVHKRPTPINVCKVDYKNGARIVDAYFEKASTTDYNGVYLGHYLDFEAKNTKSSTSFPLSNIYKHQIEHLKFVIESKGIAFFIICFETLNETYLLDARYVILFFENGGRKSIPLEDIRKNGHLIQSSFYLNIDWLTTFKQVYFPK